MFILQKIVHILILLMFINSCSDTKGKKIKNDITFSKTYMQKFTNGMSLDDIRNILLLKKKNVEFYNECTKKFEYPVNNCEKGYNLVTVVKLPSGNDLQIYFTFDSKKNLIDKSYEMYLKEK